MNGLNSFSKGMIKDVDPILQDNSSYFDAQNFRLITEHGSTSPSLVNIKGNSYKFTIPNATAVIAVNIIGTGASAITINGQTGAGLTVTSTTTPQDIANYINSDSAYTKCISNSSFTTLTSGSYNIYYNTQYLFIVGAIFNNAQNTVTSTTTTGTIYYINSTYIPAQSNLKIIGSTYIRDNIYLFTTADTSANPGGHDLNLSPTSSSVGQIWELLFDQLSETTTLSLLYNNYVDFTARHPIPPSAVLGRYENANTQRIYWTDNFNKLRSANIKDPELFALDVSLLDVKPAIDFSVPILQKISLGGTLLVGAYECVYRLKNTGGSVTKTSPVSNIVYIVQSDEGTATGGANFATYFGNPKGSATGKAITWNIKDLDTDYERIEVIVIFRDILTNVPTAINIIKDEPIPASGDYTLTFTGTEDVIPLTLEELTAIDDTFTHCKTIATKDNRLFAANLRIQRQDLDYDARAYRFPVSSLTFDIIENGVTNTYDSTTWNNIVDTSDAINANTATQLYQENSTVLGGSGPNISYEFGTIAVRADSTIEPATATAPFRHTNPEYAISELLLGVKRIDSSSDQLYPTNSINDDIKYPYYSSVLKGYDRSETYRFGITFYDKSGNPLYTKWIGDIQMPNYDDNNDNPLYEDLTASPSTDFSPVFTANKSGTTEAFVNQLFIKFNVKIPDSLSNIIDGYTICRVERTSDDKSILGTGLLNQVVSDGGALFLPDTQQAENGCPALTTAYPYLNIDNNTRANPGEASDTTPTFDCPEFLLNNFPGWKSGDLIRVVARVDISNATTTVTVGGGPEPYNMYKYYDVDAVYSGSGNEFGIEEAGLCDFAGSFSFSGTTNNTWTFNNYTRTTTNTSDALGSKTLCIGTTNQIQFNSTYGCTEGNGKKLIAQYVRPVTNQYGGNTYTDRSNNEYIACDHFRPIKSYVTTSGTTDTFKVFGGDVFTQVYDNQKEIKNWGQTVRGQYSSGGGCTPGGNVSKVSVTFFFPCCATHNTDLRSGIHVNKDLDNDAGNKASGYEGYEYNLVYSSESNIKHFFPKPTTVTDIDEFDNRVWASGIKINGEAIDSWSMFKSDDYWDVEGSYGPINALLVLQDKVFFWQDHSFGVLSINPRVLVQDSTGINLQLGTGNVIQRHDYVSTEHGCKHQWSVLGSPDMLLWWDGNKRKMLRYKFEVGLDQLSDIKGLRGYLYDNTGGEIITGDNPIYSSNLGTYGVGVHGVYDYRYNEFIYTFSDVTSQNVGGKPVYTRRAFTLAFNEEIDAFASFYSYVPTIYITNHREIYSPNGTSHQDVYLHDRGNYSNFYATVYPSTTTLVLNTNPTYSKTFDNLEWQTESINSSEVNITQDTWNTLRFYNDYQNTDYQNITTGTNAKLKERSWRYAIPRNRVLYTTANADVFNDLSTGDKSFGERMRGKYAYVDFKYNNTNNYRFVFKVLNSSFRISPR